jgi:hypothetical protein
VREFVEDAEDFAFDGVRVEMEIAGDVGIADVVDRMIEELEERVVVEQRVAGIADEPLLLSEDRLKEIVETFLVVGREVVSGLSGVHESAWKKMEKRCQEPL